MKVSVIIPARNEEVALGGTMRSLLAAAAAVGPEHDVEIIVVDSASSDGTAELAHSFAATGFVRVAVCRKPGAARARNLGAQLAAGDLLVFVDADTHVPPDAFARVLDHSHNGFDGGLAQFAALDGGLRARLWWAFWNRVRLLPLARAKAMSAFMFCTREAFDTFGPFDEAVEISEEWPVLAGLWRARRTRFIHDRSLTVLSSSRRMEMQPFGYTRTFAKYAWAVLHPSGRARYADGFRHAPSLDHLPPAAHPSRPRLWFAKAVADTSNHTLRQVEIDGQWWVEKRRRPLTMPLLPAWNMWLTVLGEPVRVESGQPWRDRERAIHRVMHHDDIFEGRRRALLIPLRPGTRADELLCGAEDHELTLTAAVEALQALHESGFTHGDAVLRNVVVDPTTGTGYWIDYETSHADGVRTPRRRADDLWTFARSAAHSLGPRYAEQIADTVVTACLDEATREALKAEISDPTRSTSVLALARSPLVGPALELLRQATAHRLTNTAAAPYRCAREDI